MEVFRGVVYDQFCKLYQMAGQMLSLVWRAERATSRETDDGIGFEPDTACREGCLGLVNMKELAQSQGWQLLIESSPGNGARIQVEIEQS